MAVLRRLRRTAPSASARAAACTPTCTCSSARATSSASSRSSRSSPTSASSRSSRRAASGSSPRSSTCNAAAANKLLKSIEEPPSYVVFLLVTDRLERVLPTIVSRCQVVEFRPVSDAEVERLPRGTATVSTPARRRGARAPLARLGRARRRASPRTRAGPRRREQYLQLRGAVVAAARPSDGPSRRRVHRRARARSRRGSRRRSRTTSPGRRAELEQPVPGQARPRLVRWTRPRAARSAKRRAAAGSPPRTRSTSWSRWVRDLWVVASGASDVLWNSDHRDALVEAVVAHAGASTPVCSGVAARTRKDLYLNIDQKLALQAMFARFEEVSDQCLGSCSVVFRGGGRVYQFERRRPGARSRRRRRRRHHARRRLRAGRQGPRRGRRRRRPARPPQGAAQGDGRRPRGHRLPPRGASASAKRECRELAADAQARHQGRRGAPGLRRHQADHHVLRRGARRRPRARRTSSATGSAAASSSSRSAPATSRASSAATAPAAAVSAAPPSPATRSPVSIRMAKDQNLPLNPTKISGCCGRLMCCLKYEHQVYVSFRKRAPKRGAIVTTPAGEGKVTELLAPVDSVTVDLGEGRVGDLQARPSSGRPTQTGRRTHELRPHVVLNVPDVSCNHCKMAIENAVRRHRRRRRGRGRRRRARASPSTSTPTPSPRRRRGDGRRRRLRRSPATTCSPL